MRLRTAMHRLQSRQNNRESRARSHGMADDVLLCLATCKELSLWEAPSTATRLYIGSTMPLFDRAGKNSRTSARSVSQQHQMTIKTWMLAYKSLSIVAAAEGLRHQAAPGFLLGHGSAAARRRSRRRLCYGRHEHGLHRIKIISHSADSVVRL